MLLRNLNQSLGLCNGTRLIVTNLGDNVIEAVIIIITGTHAGYKTYRPRINLMTRSSHQPFMLSRRQFSIKVCYSMIITLVKKGLLFPAANPHYSRLRSREQEFENKGLVARNRSGPLEGSHASAWAGSFIPGWYYQPGLKGFFSFPAYFN